MEIILGILSLLFLSLLIYGVWELWCVLWEN
jgi:hypothetical protein